MKNQVLSIEQMKHLKELGVNVSKGSMCWTKHINTEYPEIGEAFSLEASENASLGESPAEGSFWECVELIPTFTLLEMLEMMPKTINKTGKHQCAFFRILYRSNGEVSVKYSYGFDNEFEGMFFKGIDLFKCIYQMLCWLAEKGHLTKKEEEKEACHVCGKTDVELSECECCSELYCEDCSSTYNQFTQIDYNCCKPCSERERE